MGSSYLCVTLALCILWETRSFQNGFHNKRTRPVDGSAPAIATDATFHHRHDDHKFSKDLVDSLDLIPLMEVLSRHSCTRRGRQSLLALVGADHPEASPDLRWVEKRNLDMRPARNRRLMLASSELSQSRIGVSREYTNVIARNPEEAQQEYGLVAQALALLEQELHPPIYGSDSSPWDTSNIAETDYDTWLEMSAEESSLEHILQAEKVMESFRQVKNWASRIDIQDRAPLVAEIANKLPIEDLNSVYDAIAGAVRISRVRTLLDPTGKSSFNFQLNEDRFLIVKVLRDQVEEAAKTLGGKGRKPNGSSLETEFAALLENLDVAEDEIRLSLFQLVIGNSASINLAMNILARIDILFTKAAFGQSTEGRIPMVGNSGQVSIEQFVHPVLLCSEARANREVVPIELNLSSESSSGSKRRALIISGPNGGGKTAAMKSFAMAAIFCKLGLPIPCRGGVGANHLRPRVDFFESIHVNLGDKQSLMSGESTMMAQLNKCASVLEEVGSNAGPGRFSLVLLDELGGGTDPSAGGAIAQAILEKLLEVDGCRVVATTHVPRLKVLSYNSDRIGCATVLLEHASAAGNIDNKEFQRPAYHLQYDLIGDSYALDAASRSTPPLPKDVLARAAQLMTHQLTHSGTNGDSGTDSEGIAYLQALTKSMKQQAELAQAARADAEKYKDDTLACQKAMLVLASSYDRQFLHLERKMEDMFQTLRDQEKGDFELIGDTLTELRLARKRAKSQVEMLKERGLKLLPDWHDLQEGDSVVVVSEDAMNGVSATVMSAVGLPGGIVLKPDDVALQVSLPPWDMAQIDLDPMLVQAGNMKILKRSQIAIWDYDSVWEGDALNDKWVTSARDSKRKLNDILATIKASSKTQSKEVSSSKPPFPQGNNFSSSRERKAATQQNKKKQRKI